MALKLNREPKYKARPPRTAASIDTVLMSVKDGKKIRIHVKNISHGGFMALAEKPIAPSARVLVEIPGYGPCEASIRWVQDGMIGAQFTTPLEVQAVKGD